MKMMKNSDWHNVFPDIMDEKTGTGTAGMRVASPHFFEISH